MGNTTKPGENLHSEALPPKVLAARLRELEARVTERILDGIREENRRLIEAQKTLKPLLSVKDVAKTLSVSKRTVESLIAEGKLQPLWIGGQRRFHPDAIDAYIRRAVGRPAR